MNVFFKFLLVKLHLKIFLVLIIQFSVNYWQDLQTVMRPLNNIATSMYLILIETAGFRSASWAKGEDFSASVPHQCHPYIGHRGHILDPNVL